MTQPEILSTVIQALIGGGSVRSLCVATMVFLWFLLWAVNSYALDVTLQWDANNEPDLAGYKIYYDTDSGHPYEGTGATGGNSPIVITLDQDENPDQAVVEQTVFGLPNDTNFFFAVTAYDDQGLESGYSNEVNTGDEIPAIPGSLKFIASGVQIIIINQ